MADSSTPAGKQLVLGDHSGLEPVRVDIEAFFELSFWLAEELEDLIQLWKPRLPKRRTRAVHRTPLGGSQKPRPR